MNNYSTSKNTQKPFTKQTIEAIERLGGVLKRIHVRMLREGYVIKDGAIVPKQKP